MATAIHVAGSRWDGHISPDVVENTRCAKSKNDVTSIWGKIKDWICGTKTEKAKLALYELFHNEDHDKKVENFNLLKSFAGCAYQDNFAHSVTIRDDGLYDVDLSIGGVPIFAGLVCKGKEIDLSELVSQKVEQDIMDKGSSSLTQLKLDTPRAKYIIDDEVYNNGELTEERLAQLTSGMSPEQKKTLDVFATQIGLIDLKNRINALNNGMQFVGQPKFEYWVDKKEDGSIEVKYVMSQNLSEDDFHTHKLYMPNAKYPCLKLEAKVSLDTAGGYRFHEVKLFHPGIV